MEQRTCGECTKCCEGWLTASVNGHMMSPGKPCYFLSQGRCSDYNNRPEDPCKVYSCAWLTDASFPSWFKPSLSNVIISKKTPVDKNLTYYEVVEAGAKIDSTVLNWIIRWAIATSTNLIYSVDGKAYTLGSAEFTQVAPELLSA